MQVLPFPENQIEQSGDRRSHLRKLIDTNQEVFDTMVSMEDRNLRLRSLERRIDCLKGKIDKSSKAIMLLSREQELVGSKYNEILSRQIAGLSFSSLELSDLRKDIDFRECRIKQHETRLKSSQSRLDLLEKGYFELSQNLDVAIFDFERLCSKLEINASEIRWKFPLWQEELKSLPALVSKNISVLKPTSSSKTEPPKFREVTMLFNQKSFQRQFVKDLKRAKQSVLIVSPYLTKWRASDYFDLLESLIARNVQVQVITRQPESHSKKDETGEGERSHMEMNADSVIETLKSFGVEVFFENSCHQKIAIIDGALTWEGSLNIFSHRSTLEQMRRSQGEEIASQAYENVRWILKKDKSA